MRNLFFSLLCLLFTMNVWAAPKHFNESFDMIRDTEGRLVDIKIKVNDDQTLHQFIVGQLTPIIVMQQKGALDEPSLKKYLEIYQYEKWSKDERKDVQKAFRELNKFQFANLLNSPQLRLFLQKSKRLIEEYNQLRRSVARPYEPLYFYDQSMRDFFVEALAEIISDIFTGGTLGKFIDIMVDRFFDTLEQRRAFYQSALLHYADIYTPEELSMTAEEMSLVKSSIFDGRLSLIKFSKEEALNNWSNFGNNELVKFKEHCANNYEDYNKNVDFNNGALSIAFVDLLDKKQRKQLVLNFDVEAGLFTDKPSLAYDAADPEKLFRSRVVLDMISLAIDFMPIPGLLLKLPKMFIEKKYEPQIESEGALYAAAIELDNESMATVILMQSINPLIQNSDSKALIERALSAF